MIVNYTILCNKKYEFSITWFTLKWKKMVSCDLLTISGVSNEVGGSNRPPPPESPKFWQSCAEFPVSWKHIRNNLIRTRVSLICKLSGTPDYGAIAPRPSLFLPSVLNWISWTPPKKISGYATAYNLSAIINSATEVAKKISQRIVTDISLMENYTT
jgi:hypothetical protein